MVRKLPSYPPVAIITTSDSIAGRAKVGRHPSPGATGLYHLAILYPTRAALADALRRLIEARHLARWRERPRRERSTLSPRSRRNGVELYRDCPEHEWPRTPDGRLAMHTRRLDLRTLLDAPLPEDPGPDRDLA